MKQEELYSYIYDFLSRLVENKDIFPHIRQIIIFGSVVRGDFHKDSDIDLFIDTTHKIEPLIKKEQHKFEALAEKTWNNRGIYLSLKIITGDLNLPRWKELQEEILSYGKVLFGPYEKKTQQTKHSILISYELKSIIQKEKMALLRSLYGYKSKKKQKEYLQIGLLQELSGIKIGSNAFIIPAESLSQVKDLLKKHKVKFTIREIWSK